MWRSSRFIVASTVLGLNRKKQCHHSISFTTFIWKKRTFCLAWKTWLVLKFVNIKYVFSSETFISKIQSGIYLIFQSQRISQLYNIMFIITIKKNSSCQEIMVSLSGCIISRIPLSKWLGGWKDLLNMTRKLTAHQEEVMRMPIHSHVIQVKACLPKRYGSSHIV